MGYITGLQSDSASSHPTILCRELLRWNVVLTPCSPLSLLSLLTDSSHSARAVERQSLGSWSKLKATDRPAGWELGTIANPQRHSMT